MLIWALLSRGIRILADIARHVIGRHLLKKGGFEMRIDDTDVNICEAQPRRRVLIRVQLQR